MNENNIMPNLENKVWNYFDRKDDVYAICTFCDRTLSYKTTTTNLRIHLRLHGIYLEATKYNVISKVQIEEESEKQEEMVEEVLEDDILVEEEVWEDSEGEVWEPMSEDEDSEEESSKDIVNLSQQENRKRLPGRKRKSLAWNHYNILDNTYACCKHCNGKISYKSSTGNLYSHIKKKHNDIYILLGRTTRENAVRSKRYTKGKIWEHYCKIDEEYATCNYCSVKLSYKSSTGNLNVHLKRKHKINMIDENELNDEKDDDSAQQNYTDSVKIKSTPGSKRKTGLIWNYFNKIDNEFAVCKYCETSKLSYKKTSGNLSLHLKRLHPPIYLSYIQDKSMKNNNSDVKLENTKKENKSRVTSLMDEDYNSTNDIEIPENNFNILKHFYKKDSQFAICKHCSIDVSYNKSTEELNTHLRKSHTQIYMTLQMNNEKNITNKHILTNDSDPDTDNYNDHDVTYESDNDQITNINSSTSTLQIKTNKGMMEISTLSNETSKFQGEETKNEIVEIWNHFDKGDNKIANCKHCNIKISYKSSIDILYWHLKKKHGIYLTEQSNKDQITKNMRTDIWEIQSSSKALTSDSALNQSKKEKKLGEIWAHFDKIDSTHATCRYCNVILSYEATTGNLSSHLRKLHNVILKAYRINNDTNIVWICNDSSQPPIGEESQPKRRKTLKNNISQLTQDEKRRADRSLLRLFIYDFQSFSIVEDTGFSAFVNTISEYRLPNKEEISKIIQSLYEKTSTELKETVSQEACSLCLTLESWTTSQKKDYIEVTAHYINLDFEPKSVLLECACLKDGRSSKILGQEIKRILNEWQLCTKVIFAVFDNTKNLEYAVENLGWNGYGCYSHTLNLIFLQGLKPVEQLIVDVNKIIMQFKSNSNAQEMLVNYQVRHALDDHDPKDLIEDFSSHWSGTFAMLRRFIQLTEAIQYCMALDDTEWPVFGIEEWEKTSQLCKVLETFEEVTSSISRDQYMGGSLVIIITNCLRTICEDFLEKDEYSHYKPEIKEVIFNVNSDLTEKFSTIEFNKDFALCTLLDPRFKCYGFHDDSAFQDIKEHVQNLLITIIDDNEGIITKMENDIDTSKDISAWDRFDKILKQKKPRQNSDVKAERELQMYLDDDMMPRKNPNGYWNNPAEWWREHKIIYPNLSEIYRTRCNVVGTSVPWDILYSKKGHIMKERKSNLKASEVEKLVFLHANLDESELENIEY